MFAVLAFGTVYSAVGAWLPRSLPGGAPPPAWAVALGLDHPFAAWPFLACVALVFASALACTWGRRKRIRALAGGELPASATPLEARAADIRSFLESRGYRGRGDVLRRFGFALWGGWVFHVGLLVLVAAVLVQQAFHDSAFFDLTEGEAILLSARGAVFSREKGPLAPAAPPDLHVALEQFDPFLHQEGYAPDRSSRLVIAREGEAPRIATLDRAAGTHVAGVDVFQGIPTGLAVNVDIAGMGRSSIHLAREEERVASASVRDPAGGPARFVVSTERPLGDRLGTGRLRLDVDQLGRRLALEPGVPFSFGGREARVVSIGRWGRFSYSRSPGINGVFVGFAVILAGCALLAFPAGVARIAPPGSSPAARIFQVRGRDVLLAEWERMEH